MGWRGARCREGLCKKPIPVVSLEVLEVDILWPRWVARIGVTRSTEACFLTADRVSAHGVAPSPFPERLPRLVLEFRGSGPMRQTRDLSRVGWSVGGGSLQDLLVPLRSSQVASSSLCTSISGDGGNWAMSLAVVSESILLYLDS